MMSKKVSLMRGSLTEEAKLKHFITFEVNPSGGVLKDENSNCLIKGGDGAGERQFEGAESGEEGRRERMLEKSDKTGMGDEGGDGGVEDGLEASKRDSTDSKDCLKKTEAQGSKKEAKNDKNEDGKNRWKKHKKSTELVSLDLKKPSMIEAEQPTTEDGLQKQMSQKSNFDTQKFLYSVFGSKFDPEALYHRGVPQAQPLGGSSRFRKPKKSQNGVLSPHNI